jgi:hypothetical protein
MSTGVRAMIDIAVWLEDRFGMETLALGRSATDDADSVLEIAGTWLLFRVALHGPEARLAASPMDAAAAPETLLRSPDTAAGWDTVRRLIAALETHGIRSLVRPIEAWDGYDGANGFVIG